MRPVTDHRVRRRRYGTEVWLVRKNDWYVLDQVTDQIWIWCEEGIPISDMVQQLAAGEGLGLRDAVAAVVFSIVRFEDLRLIDPVCD